MTHRPHDDFGESGNEDSLADSESLPAYEELVERVEELEEEVSGVQGGGGMTALVAFAALAIAVYAAWFK